MRADVNGVDTWYEVRGEGEPVVLLHGGFSDSRDFEDNLAGLADRFRVYLVDRRAHGRTPDVPGPVTSDDLADDVAAFLSDVVGGPAHVVGYSAGGVVALAVALRHPGLVRRLVLISTAFAADGWLFLPDPAGELPAELADRYAEVSPDGRDHLPVVVAKFGEAARGKGCTAEALHDVDVPALVLAADDDLIRLDHTVAMYQALPQGQLAVVPGSSHLLLFERPGLCRGLVADFLTTDPHRLMPIARAPR
ncbi:alpha/beta hydrolase [Saccharothrix violaceirubra]|uniref:Pimeloyl-ACP methyl ester carboxylesterase n=1 Tax=Saccharothrix violaceirubra TaxID=413306 RepID=A0A7W7WUJ8_9PSEU|nr:alpha/beta hydrolase [Saccharothrix violaceirubra]MBB4964339.1 pimeloyl-ACP methyl ester carboxylesterase [Saccharothrix violaceirubra]